MLECKGCGNHLHLEQPVCPYCGSRNPDYKEPKTSIKVERVIEKATENVEKAKLNVCLLIFLIIIFWPGAIIYAIVKLNQQK